MPISIQALQIAASRQVVAATESFNIKQTSALKTVFLCHSHHDTSLAKGLVNLLSDAGWGVYIDWQDATMPSHPNHKTAKRIKQKITTLEYFLFLATPNSMSSRWCPWEIGFADGQKDHDHILIVPTEDGTHTHGNEYLELYRCIDWSSKNELAVWESGQNTNGIFVKDL